jgi:O-antigen ligase
MDFLLEGFGVLGLLLLLAAFILNAKKHTKRRTLMYNGLNFLGSMVMGIYAIAKDSTAFILLEFIWAIIALYFLFSILHERHIKPRIGKKDSKKNKKTKK